MGQPIQSNSEQVAQIVTSAPSTSATLAGGFVGWLLGNQGEILFFLSAALILCQLGAFGYRFVMWLRVRKNSDEG